MAATLKEIESRMPAVMPIESTIDRALHATAIASVVFDARRQLARETEERVAETRSRVETTSRLVRLLNGQMHDPRT